MTPSKEQIIEWAMSAGFLQFGSGKFAEQEAIEQFAATVYAEAYANGQEDMRERCATACRKEREKFVAKAGENNGRESDFAFGSINSAERLEQNILALPITQHSDAQPCDTERAIEAALAGKAGQQCNDCNGMGIQDGQGDKCPLCDSSGTQPTDPATEWMAVASSAVLALSDAASWLPDGQNKRTVALAADRIQKRARALIYKTMLDAASTQQQAQPNRTGCTAGSDEECTNRRCATNCPALPQKAAEPEGQQHKMIADAKSALNEATTHLRNEDTLGASLALQAVEKLFDTLSAPTQQPLLSHADELTAMERYIEMITQDRDSAHDFLTRAGIIDSNGNLAEQYRDIVETEACHRHHRE